MSRRWKGWVQLTYPLSGKAKAEMVAACDAEYTYANVGKVKRVGKSPAQQFDESHKIWLENGRDE